MNNSLKLFFQFLCFVILLSPAYSSEIERNYPDPDYPAFWKGTLEDIHDVIQSIQRGDTKAIAISPGGRPVYCVTYGEKPDLHSQANYNSAVAARDYSYYAKKDESTPPIFYFVGPPHGQEIEGVVGLLNLIQVAETGKDFRGKNWPRLKKAFDQCRVIIVPLSNPDGRARCPYHSFVGIPRDEMTRVGQGTHEDGTMYGWPGAKQRHPMNDDIGILGAYFNDAGINLMHDEFFNPMTEETKALLRLAREEAPDYILNLHSMGHASELYQTTYVPMFHKEIIYAITQQVHKRLKEENLPTGSPNKPQADGEKVPPPSFNLTSALHHVSGGVSMLFECSHGLIGENMPRLTHDEILDTQLLLYEELLIYAVENPHPQLKKE